jgi:hypothetical protein
MGMSSWHSWHICGAAVANKNCSVTQGALLGVLADVNNGLWAWRTDITHRRFRKLRLESRGEHRCVCMCVCVCVASVAHVLWGKRGLAGRLLTEGCVFT